jgi:hypothetical protein
MRKYSALAVLFGLALVVSAVFGSTSAQAAPSNNACWGQATQVFARTGIMGEHASQQPTLRLGLRNLARELYEQGVLDNDTMQALGAFVAQELGLRIDACM